MTAFKASPIARFRVLAGAVIWLAACLVEPPVQAQSAENVAVIVNDNSQDSRRIGEYYARVRNLPLSHVLRIKTSTDDQIERDAYVKTIERPLGVAITRAALQDRLLYLVLTKGVPLRIAGTAGVSGTMASVDSELTLLYRRMAGQPTALEGKIDNPYYLGAREIGEARPFSHREHDIYLVTRIDAFTVDQALALIDRAQSPSRRGPVVLDQRRMIAAADKWLERTAARVANGTASDVSVASVSDAGADRTEVLGYYSLGASASADASRRGLTFARGSIAASLGSFDARTFHQPADGWRPTHSSDSATWFEGSGEALVGELIRDGVTGVAGQVGEAYALGAVRPDILFPAYLAGFNLVEAFYLAVPKLSWQTVVVGDPLCAPFGRTVLGRDELEEGVDEATGLPGFFAKRRVAAFRAANRELSERVGSLAVRFHALLE